MVKKKAAASGRPHDEKQLSARSTKVAIGSDAIAAKALQAVESSRIKGRPEKSVEGGGAKLARVHAALIGRENEMAER